jgi:hypothetical protein
LSSIFLLFFLWQDINGGIFLKSVLFYLNELQNLFAIFLDTTGLFAMPFVVRPHSRGADWSFDFTPSVGQLNHASSNIETFG